MARPPQSVSEIAELDGLSRSDLLCRVHERGDEFGLETLAYLLRKGLREGDHDLVREAAEHIPPHLEPIARKAARRWGLDWEEVYQEALAVMWKDFITKQDVPLIYWEERYYGAFKKKCMTIVKQMSRCKADDDELQHVLAEEVDRGDLLGVEDAVRTLDPRAIVTVLRGLSLKQRQAVVLAWREGRPISGREGSVSHVMGISPSMVHRHLRLAALKIAELRETDPELRRLLGLEE